MGDYANDILEGVCDIYGDYTYKDSNYKYKKHPLTHAEKCIKHVRKELAILIKQTIKENPTKIVNESRAFINRKYGNDWRSRGLCINNSNQWKDLSEY